MLACQDPVGLALLALMAEWNSLGKGSEANKGGFPLSLPALGASLLPCCVSLSVYSIVQREFPPRKHAHEGRDLPILFIALSPSSRTMPGDRDAQLIHAEQIS